MAGPPRVSLSGRGSTGNVEKIRLAEKQQIVYKKAMKGYGDWASSAMDDPSPPTPLPASL